MPTCITLNSNVDFTVTSLSAPQDGYSIAIAQATPTPTPGPTSGPTATPSPSPSETPLPSATPASAPTGYFEVSDPRLYNVAMENDAGNGIMFSNWNWAGASAMKLDFIVNTSVTVAVFLKNTDTVDSAEVLLNGVSDLVVAAGTEDCKVYNLINADYLSIKKVSGSFPPDSVSGYISSLNNTCPGTALAKYPIRRSEDINSARTVTAFDFTNYRIMTLLATTNTAIPAVLPPDNFVGWLYSPDLTTYTIYINSTDSITMEYCPDSSNTGSTLTYTSSAWNTGIAMSAIPSMTSLDLIFSFKIASGNKNYEIKII